MRFSIVAISAEDLSHIQQAVSVLLRLLVNDGSVLDPANSFGCLRLVAFMRQKKDGPARMHFQIKLGTGHFDATARILENTDVDWTLPDGVSAGAFASAVNRFFETQLVALTGKPWTNYGIIGSLSLNTTVTYEYTILKPRDCSAK